MCLWQHKRFFSFNKQSHLAKHTCENTAGANRQTSEAGNTGSLYVSRDPGAAPLKEGQRAGGSAGGSQEQPTAGAQPLLLLSFPQPFSALPPLTLKGAAKSKVLWGRA